MHKEVETHYYALFRDRTSKDKESLQTICETAGELYQELDRRYSFKIPQTSVRVAINDEFAAMTAPIHSGDRLVFIPPVAGG